jgi:hypothetical protein
VHILGKIFPTFLLIKNVGKIKNVKKRAFYSKNKKRKKRFSQIWMKRLSHGRLFRGFRSADPSHWTKLTRINQ